MNNDYDKYCECCSSQRTDGNSSAPGIYAKMPSPKNTIYCSTNLAEKYAEESKKLLDEVKVYLDEVRDIVQNGTDISTEYVDNIKASLEQAINNKQNSGDYAEKSEVTDMETRINSLIDTKVDEVRLPDVESYKGGFLKNDGVDVLWNKESALSTVQVTNCLLEIPQRIKYTLQNGTLTIKEGSVLTVPYGTEDLTETYPKGSIFLNNNFKVADSTYSNGRFTLWVELQNAIAYNTPFDNTVKCYCAINCCSNYAGIYSYEDTNFSFNTTNNMVTHSLVENSVYSLPVLLCNRASSGISSVDTVFNGRGYIGSAFWVDKGVSGLISAGKNEDGTLKNIPFTTDNVLYGSASGTINSGVLAITPGSAVTGVLYTIDSSTYTVTDIPPSTLRWYNPDENKYYIKTNGVWSEDPQVHIGSFVSSANGITDSQMHNTFRAVDFEEIQKLQKLTDEIKSDCADKIEVIESYQNETSWCRVYSNKWCEQGGRLPASTKELTYLKEFTDTNYSFMSTYVGAQGKSGTWYPLALTTTGATMPSATIPIIWETRGYIK